MKSRVKGLSMAVCSFFVCSAWAGSAPVEQVRASGAEGFNQAQSLSLPAIREAAGDVQELIQGPRQQFNIQSFKVELTQANLVGQQLLGSFVLASQLNANRHIMNRVLGNTAYDLGMAADATNTNQYLTFTDPQGKVTVVRAVQNDLIGKGVTVTLNPSTTYLVKVSIDIFSPARNSKVHITPVNGNGPSYQMTTGDLQDAVKAKSYVFDAGGKEWWVQYGNIVDPNTNQFTNQTGFLFANVQGVNTYSYPVMESLLTVGQPYAANLGGVTVNLVKTADGQLQIFQ